LNIFCDYSMQHDSFQYVYSSSTVCSMTCSSGRFYIGLLYLQILKLKYWMQVAVAKVVLKFFKKHGSMKYKKLSDLELESKKPKNSMLAPTLYRWVSHDRHRCRWKAQWSEGRGHQVHLGEFKDQQQAAAVVAAYINKSKQRKRKAGFEEDESVVASKLLLRKDGKTKIFIERFKFFHSLYTDPEPCYPGAAPWFNIRYVSFRSIGL